jgi:predicted GNAT family acetyltransferase
VKNCYIIHLADKPENYPQIGIADLTNVGEMVPGTMTITRVNIPAAHRGKGKGTELLKMILTDADQYGVLLSLEIMPSGSLDYEALYDWYVRHGFFTHPDYAGVLVRVPQDD